MTSSQGKAMKSERRNRMARFGAATVMLFALFSTKATAEQWEAVLKAAVNTAPEPAPQQPPANNWFNVSTPGVRALAPPGSLIEYGSPPGGVCCPGKKNGHFCRRLLAWATYFPKEHVNSFTNCCNSCHYKGVEPPYLVFLNPKCYEGSGLQKAFANECYRGCDSCAGGAAAGHP